jgi:2,3-bisphosphoglycerate-dependent phosphoglycerate mutase
MPKLILLRHLKSQWNLENRFAGWTDGPLSKEGKEKAREIMIKISQIGIDVFYTSPLFRNEDTIARILEYTLKYPIFIHLDGGKMQRWGKFADISENDIPVFVSEKLNERYYGELQGLNKEETKRRYGEEKVRLWRRSYAVSPPGGESLREVAKRTVPFYKKYIEKDLKAGKNVLIVASHNSLRAVAKHVEKIPDKVIINLEIDYAGLIEYDLDESLKLKNKKIW